MTVTTLKVVTGIIQNKAGLFFIALRPSHVPYSGIWEFPGGKIEPGESPYDALVRELKEEIGITVEQAHLFMQFQYPYPDRSLDLSAWLVTQYQGEPYGAEGQTINWVPRQ